LLTLPWSSPLREHSLITRLRLRMADPCTKFEVSSTGRCGDFIWGVKFSNGSPDPDHAPFRKNFSSAGWDLPQSFLTTLIYDYRIEFQKLSIWSHERRISATFSQRMLRNSYLQTSGKMSDTTIRIPDPDFLMHISLFARWQHTTNNRKHITKHT